VLSAPRSWGADFCAIWRKNNAWQIEMNVL
jgi:hypothetical protein